jgi:hypothetical protein
LRVIGTEVLSKALENTLVRLAHTKETGSRTNLTVKGSKHGKMVASMKAATKEVKNQAKASTLGQIHPLTAVTGYQEKSLARAHIVTLTTESTMEVSWTIRCTEKELTLGQMEESTLGFTRTIRSQVKAGTSGQMDDITKVNGEMASEMGTERLFFRIRLSSTVFGKMTKKYRSQLRPMSI